MPRHETTVPCGINSEQARSGSWAMFFKTVPSFFLAPYYYYRFQILQRCHHNVKCILTSKEYSSHYTGNRIIHDADRRIFLLLEKMLWLLDDFQRLSFSLQRISVSSLALSAMSDLQIPFTVGLTLLQFHYPQMSQSQMHENSVFCCCSFCDP